jgi:hypothetical protein
MRCPCPCSLDHVHLVHNAAAVHPCGHKPRGRVWQVHLVSISGDPRACLRRDESGETTASVSCTSRTSVCCAQTLTGPKCSSTQPCRRSVTESHLRSTSWFAQIVGQSNGLHRTSSLRRILSHIGFCIHCRPNNPNQHGQQKHGHRVSRAALPLPRKSITIDPRALVYL